MQKRKNSGNIANKSNDVSKPNNDYLNRIIEVQNETIALIKSMNADLKAGLKNPIIGKVCWN